MKSNKDLRLVLPLIATLGMSVITGCSAGGSSNNNSSSSSNSNSSSTPSGRSSVASGFSVDATGLFAGELGDFPNRIGSINFFVNSSGVMESGNMSFPNGARISWTPSQPWPAGNPGIEGTTFLTTDVANGASETYQGVFNSVAVEYTGTYGAGADYPIVGGTSGSFVARKTANAVRAAARKLNGQLFIAPGEATRYDATMSLYDDESAVVTATAPDGESIMVVGKQVRPKGLRKVTPATSR